MYNCTMTTKSRGRQKIKMVKISNESNLLVTFSKRRAGLFKKASELSTLCGAEIGIIVFSPGKKVFSYGHPSMEAIIDRYISGNIPETSGAMQLIEAHRNIRLSQLNFELTQVLNQMEIEKKRGEDLDEMKKVRQYQCWWEASVEELHLTQLEQLKISLQELRQTISKQAEQLLIQNGNQPQIFTPNATNGILPFDPTNLGFQDYLIPFLGSGSGLF